MTYCSFVSNFKIKFIFHSKLSKFKFKIVFIQNRKIQPK
jgi:hypothetical protein